MRRATPRRADARGYNVYDPWLKHGSIRPGIAA
jgi:hypothetical protein